jgi:hypothetical protein
MFGSGLRFQVNVTASMGTAITAAKRAASDQTTRHHWRRGKYRNAIRGRLYPRNGTHANRSFPSKSQLTPKQLPVLLTTMTQKAYSVSPSNSACPKPGAKTPRFRPAAPGDTRRPVAQVSNLRVSAFPQPARSAADPSRLPQESSSVVSVLVPPCSLCDLPVFLRNPLKCPTLTT